MVVGRRVLGAYVSALCGGTGLKKKPSTDDAQEEDNWAKVGEEAFRGDNGSEQRGEIVEAVLASEGLAGWCEEQVGRETSASPRLLANGADHDFEASAGGAARSRRRVGSGRPSACSYTA